MNPILKMQAKHEVQDPEFSLTLVHDVYNLSLGKHY